MRDIDLLLRKIEAVLEGIDKDDIEDEGGWWETSTGVEFGKERLEMIRELFKEYKENA